MHLKKTNNDRLIEGAIFDVDGTLLDTMPVWHDAGARYLATMDIEAEEGLGDRLFADKFESGALIPFFENKIPFVLTPHKISCPIIFKTST